MSGGRPLPTSGIGQGESGQQWLRVVWASLSWPTDQPRWSPGCFAAVQPLVSPSGRTTRDVFSLDGVLDTLGGQEYWVGLPQPHSCCWVSSRGCWTRAWAPFSFLAWGQLGTTLRWRTRSEVEGERCSGRRLAGEGGGCCHASGEPGPRPSP